MPTTTCLSEAELRELAVAARGGREPVSAGSHLEHCPTCRAAFEEWRKNLDYMAVLKGALGDSLELGEPVGDPLEMLHEFTGEGGCQPERPDIPGYNIIREIHRGGQGIVYEAVQLSTRRTVAVKVLLEGPLASERDKWRFEREVKLIAALRHPNIVVIHDSGIAHGRYFFAMDYVCGQPLDTHVRMKAPTVKEIIPLFRQVCEAVAHAHGRGIIHRDLKPSNILVGEDGRPCVLDFGLAKITGDQIAFTQRGLASIPGNIMGTLRYMAPEQTVGDHEAVDVRTDIYALGVILYELLTGEAPYRTSADLSEALKNIREVDPPRPSSLRREAKSELDAIVLKALAKEPERRYPTASQLADDLSAWMDGRPISAKSASSLYVLRKMAFRHGFETLVLMALVVTILSFSWLGLQSVIYARGMKAERDASNSALSQVDEAKFLAEFGVRESLHQMKMGWFFDEWHSGRPERARSIRDGLPAGAPERAAMSFLLDGWSVDDLKHELSGKAVALMHLAIGERHLQTKEPAAALEAFELSRKAATGANRWWAGIAEGRVLQLRESAASAPSP